MHMPWLMHTCAMTPLYMPQALASDVLSTNGTQPRLPIYVRHDSFMHVPWPSHLCCHDSSIRVLWLIHICSWLILQVLASILPYPIGRQPVHQGHVCQDSFIRVPWLMHVCAMTHIAGASQCFAIHNWDTTWAPQSILAGRAYTSYLGYSGVPWLFHMCAMTHSYVCHDSLICVPWLIAYTGFLSHSGVLWLFHVCHDSFIYMPWLIQTMTHFIH